MEALSFSHISDAQQKTLILPEVEIARLKKGVGEKTLWTLHHVIFHLEEDLVMKFKPWNQKKNPGLEHVLHSTPEVQCLRALFKLFQLFLTWGCCLDICSQRLIRAIHSSRCKLELKVLRAVVQGRFLDFRLFECQTSIIRFFKKI